MREQTGEAPSLAARSPLMAHDQPSARDDASPQDERTPVTSRDHEQPRPRQPSLLLSLLLTGAVGLICGVIGAMGYQHYVGSKAGALGASQSHAEAGSSQLSSSKTKSEGDPKSESAKQSSSQGPSSSPGPGSTAAVEAEELKEQISNLSRRMDRLGQEVERLQQLLSLAVPILQRIAPKS
jgi:hypothetical protein